MSPLQFVKSSEFCISGVPLDYAQVLALQHEGEVALCLGTIDLPCWTQYPFPHNAGMTEWTTDRLGPLWQQFPAASTKIECKAVCCFEIRTRGETCCLVIHLSVLSVSQIECPLLLLSVTPLTPVVEISTLQPLLISQMFYLSLSKKKKKKKKDKEKRNKRENLEY